MALQLFDRVQVAATANTTVSFTLGVAVPGYQDFSVMTNGNTTYYGSSDGTNWEVGIGTYSSTGPTLTRTTILSSSNAGSAVTFTSAPIVWIDYPSAKAIYQDDNGNVGIGVVPTASAGTLQVGTASYSDTGIVASFASTVAGYNQIILQNKDSGTGSSTNFNVSNNNGTSSTNYGEFGINSSTFSGTGSFSAAGYTYLASASTDLAIGTYGSNAIHFVVNSGASDAMTIDTSSNVGIGTIPSYRLHVNNSSAGTTIARFTDGTNSTIDIQMPSAGLGAIVSPTNPLAFYVNSSERMRIYASGGVAVGATTDPGANNLFVAGNLQVNSSIVNSRVTPRVLASTANSATPTLNTNNYDMMVITGQSVAITSFTTNLTGTPTNGQKLWISITGTGAIAITWGTSFESSTVTLPTTTVTTARLDVGFVWNVATSKWRCVATA